MPLDRLTFPSIVVGSSNDPFVSIRRAMTFASEWGARFVHLRDSGHINAASGFGSWPDGLRLASQLWQRRNPVADPLLLKENGYALLGLGSAAHSRVARVA